MAIMTAPIDRPAAAQPSNASAPNVLALLEEQARHDLQRLNYPAADWMPATPGADGKPLLDTLIVGAGMCGQTAAFALLRDGVRNLRVIDRGARGDEGPWSTFARMPILRSPKHLVGPDLGVGSLTFRAWYEAQHGAEGWDQLYKIGTLEWRDYLLWVRAVAGVPVENDTALIKLEAAGAHLKAQLRGPLGDETVYARKVVLAMGRDGSGAPRLPQFNSFDAASTHTRARVSHSMDAIDFHALAGKRIGLLGAGSSAFDNAGTALEAGAATVTMFARRTHLPQVNKSKWASFPGFQNGYAALDDATRWKCFTYIMDEQVPPPHESVLRCDSFAGFSIRFAEPWIDLHTHAAGVTVTTPKGQYEFDAVIFGTGFDVDLLERDELKHFRADTLTWRDRVGAETAAHNAEAARFPYLGDAFELQARSTSASPALANLHIFNWGATMSHGQLAGDIPGLGVGVSRLTQGIVRDLFVAEQAHFLDKLHAHAEYELKTTRYFVPPATAKSGTE